MAAPMDSVIWLHEHEEREYAAACKLSLAKWREWIQGRGLVIRPAARYRPSWWTGECEVAIHREDAAR